VPVLTDDQIRSLLRVCRRQGFEEIRDTALIRLLFDPACAARRRPGSRAD
jgi:hypothetical protein